MLEPFGALEPLFKVLPLDQAMPELLPKQRSSSEIIAIASEIEPNLSSAALRAALWLYVDDLDRSHTISQGISDSAGAFWHGIMHRREGDFSNSKYWFRQAGAAPFSLPGYEPSAFVDEVQKANGSNPNRLLELQRNEWQAMFAYCAAEHAARSL